MSVLNLNLINFEHPKTKSSKYVLTSPKSLKACQKAGIKPVELLYKSLEDVKKEFGRKEARATYEQLENERQRKLEMCRKIRNELLMEGYPRCKKISPILEVENNNGSSRSTPVGQEERQSTSSGSLHKGCTASLPSLAKTERNTPVFEEGNMKPTDKKQEAHIPVLNKNGRQRKLPRSQSLPSRADDSPTLKSEKAESRSGSSVGHHDYRVITDCLANVNAPSHNLPGKLSLPESPISTEGRKQEHHVSFDSNNNLFKYPVIMRPHPSKRRKCLERRKLVECRKMFDKILAQYKDPEYCLSKYRQIIDNSIERELREQEVKKVQRRIEDGFEMWQDKVLMLQWLDIERAEEQVSRNLNSKMEKLRQKQRNKEIVHALNLNKVKEDDDIKAEILRRELEEKERKMKVLQEEKERVIFESKSRALAVSELKEQIRNIMTPETFDQKANKCRRTKKAVEMFCPPEKCSNIMQQSHICLG